MEKQFESTARGAKASDYKQGKDEAQKAKAAEVAEAKAKDKDKGKGKGTSPDTKKYNCWGCGKVLPAREDLTKHLPTCVAKDQVCTGCKTKGAVPKHCGKCERQKLSKAKTCLLYTSPSPRDATLSRMPSSA